MKMVQWARDLVWSQAEDWEKVGISSKSVEKSQVCVWAGVGGGAAGRGGIAFKTNQSHSKRQTLKFQPLGPHIFLLSIFALHFRKLPTC